MKLDNKKIEQWFKFTRNWININGWKVLISFGLALIIFYTIKPNLQTLSLSLPIVVKTGNGNAIMAVRPTRAAVTFKGTEAEIQNIRQDERQLRLEVQLRGRDGNHLNLTRRNSKVTGTKRARYSIDETVIEVVADELEEVNFEIAEPSFTGKPFRGFVHYELSQNTAESKEPSSSSSSCASPASSCSLNLSTPRAGQPTLCVKWPSSHRKMPGSQR